VDGEWTLIIADNGIGLRPTAGRDGGIGLKMMTYRARLLRGTIALEAGTPRGTRLTLTAPLDEIGTIETANGLPIQS